MKSLPRCARGALWTRFRSRHRRAPLHEQRVSSHALRLPLGFGGGLRYAKMRAVDLRIDRHPVFRSTTNLPNQALFNEHHVALPTHAGLTCVDVQYIVDSVNDYAMEKAA